MAIDDILNSVHTDKNDTNDEVVVSVKTNAQKKEPAVCNFDISNETVGLPNVKVFGVGGAGNNIISYLEKLRSWPRNINFWAFNTDKKTLIRLAKSQINSSLFLIGEKKLNGFGSGGDPIVGKEAFEENKSDAEKILGDDTDILFIIAGLGKGTGSGVSPEIAKLARSKNIITVGIVTLPSINVEGNKTYENAMKSYDELQSECDSLCAISNDKIILSNDKTTFISQLEQGNKEIGSIISDFADVINDAGEFNIDFNDLKSFIRNNKHFFHTMIRVKTDCTYDELNKILKSAIDDSYSNINFDLTEIEVICNFQINKNTPTNLVSDTRKLLEKISRTHNIKFTYGIQNTENEEEAVISLFLSNSQQTSDTYKKNNDIENKQDYNTDDFTVKNDDTYVKEIIKSATTKRITKKLFSWGDEEEDTTNHEQHLTELLNENEN